VSSAQPIMSASVKSLWGAAVSALRAPLAALLLAVFAAAPFAPSAAAATPPEPARLGPKDKALVADIEDFLNGITTLEAAFVQLTAQGSYAKGKFYLKRPGRMRFEYDPPLPYLLVSDGTWFIYVDKQLEQVTYLPLKKTPADLLLRDSFSFSEGLVITRLERGAGTVQIDIADQDDPDLGRVTLTFVREPLTLRSWTIRDPQGQRIQVTLMNPLYGLQLDNDLFRFVNTFRGPPRQLD